MRHIAVGSLRTDRRNRSPNVSPAAPSAASVEYRTPRVSGHVRVRGSEPSSQNRFFRRRRAGRARGLTLSPADISPADTIFDFRLEVVARDSPADRVFCLLLMEKQGSRSVLFQHANDAQAQDAAR